MQLVGIARYTAVQIAKYIGGAYKLQHLHIHLCVPVATLNIPVHFPGSLLLANRKSIMANCDHG